MEQSTTENLTMEMKASKRIIDDGLIHLHRIAKAAEDCLCIRSPLEIPQFLLDSGAVSIHAFQGDTSDLRIRMKDIVGNEVEIKGSEIHELSPLFIKWHKTDSGTIAYPDPRGEHAYTYKASLKDKRIPCIKSEDDTGESKPKDKRNATEVECFVHTPSHKAFVLQKGMPIPTYFEDKGVHIVGGNLCVLSDDMGSFTVPMPTKESPLTYCIVDFGHKIGALDLHSDHECKKFMVELGGIDVMLLSEYAYYLLSFESEDDNT